MDEQRQPQEYFTVEIENKIREMSDTQMQQSLASLEQSEFWIAILRYNQMRLQMSQSALFQGDPVKEPTMMTRQQGIMLGISDLQNAVISLVQDREDKAKEADARAEADGTDVE